jgi:molybdopterin molybdotransferase
VEFLTSLTPEQALKVINTFPLPSPDAEQVPLDQAPGRVLAADIIAREDIPPFPRSLVDGYAVKAKDTYGAREGSPAFLLLKGAVAVGEVTEAQVGDGEAVGVATGAMLPAGADGVVMEEHTRRAADGVEVTHTVRQKEHICFRGEDLEAGQVALEKGKVLSPFDIGVLAALGVVAVPVYRQVLVGIVSSGNEIVAADKAPPPGKVRDINTHTVSGLLRNRGCLVRFAGIARDRVKDLAEKLTVLKGCDMLLLSGGSSKGQSDFMTSAVELLGGKTLFHGLNIKPGKPTVFASLWDKPVFGLPGHPVSCAMVVLRFVLPLAARLRGEKGEVFPRTQAGTLSTNVPSTYGIEEYVRVTVARQGNRTSVTPLFAKSSVISTLSRADGYIIVRAGKEGLEAGEEVEVYPLG